MDGGVMALDVRGVIFGLGVLTAAGLAYAALRAAGPVIQPTFSEDLMPPIEPHLAQVSEHIGDVVFARHRYPARVGGEITAIMHNGWSMASVPTTAESMWITCPPGNVDL